jgi:hypothetical protein
MPGVRLGPWRQHGQTGMAGKLARIGLSPSPMLSLGSSSRWLVCERGRDGGVWGDWWDSDNEGVAAGMGEGLYAGASATVILASDFESRFRGRFTGQILGQISASDSGADFSVRFWVQGQHPASIQISTPKAGRLTMAATSDALPWQRKKQRDLRCRFWVGRSDKQ